MDLKVAEERAKAIFEGLYYNCWDLDSANPDNWLWKDYWKCGNTLDSALSYLALVPQEQRIVDPGDLIRKCYINVFIQRFEMGPWRDDYSWWGLAFANGALNSKVLNLDQTDTKVCHDSAVRCWNIMKMSAAENQKFSDKEEDVLIGAGFACWNGPTASAAQYVAYHEHGLTYDFVPNTVTNIGFCALSIALHRITGEDAYLDAMADTLRWFVRFKQYGGMLINEKGLVVETPNPRAHLPWCHDPTRGWTADQAVFLHCLYEALALIDKKTKYADLVTPLTNLRNELENGYRNKSNTLINQDDLILREYNTTDVPLHGDPNWGNFNDNYATGPGVFMRYLGRFYPAMTEKNAAEVLAQVMQASAEGAWKHRIAKNDGIGSSYERMLFWYADVEDTRYRQYYINPNIQIWALLLQTNGLDLYTALIKLLRKVHTPAVMQVSAGM